MIATGLTNNYSFLQCKNSYQNDPTKIDGDDIEIILISLDPSDSSSEWTLFYEDKYGNSCIDAFFISIELSA